MYASHHLHLSLFLNLYRFLYFFTFFTADQSRKKDRKTRLLCFFYYHSIEISYLIVHLINFLRVFSYFLLTHKFYGLIPGRIYEVIIHFLTSCYQFLFIHSMLLLKTFLFFYCELVQVLKVDHSHEGRGKATLKVFFLSFFYSRFYMFPIIIYQLTDVICCLFGLTYHDKCLRISSHKLFL